MFKGCMTALITPFRDGAVDDKAFQTFVDWQIKQGINGVVPCGTTGESPAMTHDEHERINQLCVEAAAGRVPVIAGCGSNYTDEAISLTAHAKRIGADASLQVTPYYNKPTQEGLYAHFKAIHDAVDLPMIIYNIPGRSVVDMTVATMARLAELPNVVGVKDATNDLARPVHTREVIGADFCQLSGEDGTIGAFLGQGGHGIISVVSNVAPAISARMHEAWWARDIDRFSALRDQLHPLARALFVETSPAPVKYAASLLGICSEEVRLPLVTPTEPTRALVREVVATLGLQGPAATAKAAE